MEIGVDGWRASAGDWDAVRNLPVDKLPALTQEQREVARKLGIRIILVSEEGRQVLQLAAVNLAESQFLWVYVDDSDDGGLWARVPAKMKITWC